jgi:hypothetical protein
LAEGIPSPYPRASAAPPQDDVKQSGVWPQAIFTFRGSHLAGQSFIMSPRRGDLSPVPLILFSTCRHHLQ